MNFLYFLLYAILNTISKLFLSLISIGVNSLIMPLSLSPTIFLDVIGLPTAPIIAIVISVSLFLATVMTAVELFKCITSTDPEKKSPIQVIRRFGLSVIFISLVLPLIGGILGFSQQFVIFGEFNLSSLYNTIKNINDYSYLETFTRFLGKIVEISKTSSLPKVSSYFLPLNMVKTSKETVIGLIYLILTTGILISISIIFIRFLLEIVERYLSMFLNFMLLPIFMAFYASPDTEGTTKKAFQGFFASVLIFFLDLIFLKMIMLGFNQFGSVSASNGYFILEAAILFSVVHIAIVIDSFVSNYIQGAFNLNGFVGSEMFKDIYAISKLFK